MATDFALFLRRFLTAYLAGLRGCSPNTVASYRRGVPLTAQRPTSCVCISPRREDPDLHF